MTEGEGFYQYPENPTVTKAWMCIRIGERQRALELLSGYKDPEYQVKLIEGFIQRENNGAKKPRRKTRKKVSDIRNVEA